jgi:uncharacterized protein YdeI (YjbR/CyaY-like superfamily)
MTRRSSPPAPLYFASASAFRSWLAANSATSSELVVGFYRVGTGRPSLTWPESVDEALCFGWIDGVRKRVDDHAYQIRFTPRKKDSIWSAVNITRARALIAEGRMMPAGLAAFRKRIARRSSVYSYEQAGALELEPGELRMLRKNKAAWKYFQNVAPSYRRTMLYWIVSAKQKATRARRLARLIEASAAGVRLLP